jgi:hypothetical protein
MEITALCSPLEEIMLLMPVIEVNHILLAWGVPEE